MIPEDEYSTFLADLIVNKCPGYGEVDESFLVSVLYIYRYGAITREMVYQLLEWDKPGVCGGRTL